MPWSIQMNDIDNYMEIIYSGYVTNEESTAATQKALSLASKDGQLFLTDLSDAELSHSVVDLYQQPELWESLGSNRKSRMALVIKDDSGLKDRLSFLETVSLNRGWDVRLFVDRDHAIDWLISKTR